MSPAGDNKHGGKEEKNVAPMDSGIPNVMSDAHREDSQDDEEEEEPREEELAPPGSQTVAGQEVADCGDRGEQAKETTVENHLAAILHLVGQGHGDQGDARYQVADVEEEEEA